jgi:hypothetical protein
MIEIKPYQGERGFSCMPLKKNIPVGREGLVLVNCPSCGQECWKSPQLERVISKGAPIDLMCTECALRSGMPKLEK